MAEYICKEVQTDNGGYLEITNELIRCKDCIKKSLCMIYRETNDNYGYCSWAGRKE